MDRPERVWNPSSLISTTAADARSRSLVPPWHGVFAALPVPTGGRAGERDVPTRLRVQALGRTRVDRGDERLSGAWLGHKPGQLLKYLVCERDRVVPLDELLDVLWPDAGRAGAANVRQAVHTLRDRLEPERVKGRASSFVLATGGGYELARERLLIDADEFEARARAGRDALRRGDLAAATSALDAAADAYTGDFLADEPYAEWASSERERLRDLVADVLRGLTAARLADEELDAAVAGLRRLVALDPLDLGAQRELLALLTRRDRHSEAARRYELLRRRYKRAFGAELGFTLRDLAGR